MNELGDGYMVKVLYGTMTVKHLVYHIERKVTGKWWRRKTRYYVVCDVARLGPFETYEEAGEMLRIANGGEF